MYQHIKIYFMDEMANDIRMKHIMHNRAPCYIKNIRDDKDSQTLLFKEEIYTSDSELQKNNIISEITVPLLYKGMIPFGYIQVNSNTPLTDAQNSSIRKFGITTSELISKDESLIKPSLDKFVVTDLSMQGLGIIFKEKTHIKHFKEQSYIYFLIYFEETKHTTVLAKVMNINLINNLYRVGCEIENIDPIGEVYYTEFLEHQ